ncbi:hypothetical protein SAMN04515647_1359 [Cohaesibacter sp. ES.047]|uniref:DUF2218 domain-containing protein n=1 Tax=Cohaesibacter sp. ES.047 TaxID=1798205 RepID=UPI000BB92432|nr:DUF2218 domain-containing protein [Cohaesibacter sp. ES.047]SNY91149.1 hypothetical protein SAMN04515647_1359 [Cohaesibacter sp. ES.047]
MQSIATVKTLKAERYLVQLCEHFCRKVPAESEGGVGWVDLPIGRLDLKASDQGLTLTLAGDDSDKLTQLEEITQRHLERFAFREDLTIVWHRKKT